MVHNDQGTLTFQRVLKAQRKCARRVDDDNI